MYDGANVVLVFDASSSLTNRFLHGPAVDQVFADENALGEVLWGLPDNQGTIRDVAEYDSATDTTSVVNHIKYDSFGNITAESDPTVDFLYAYTGRAWDADAELYYYRARWYDPSLGRFLSEDPLGFADEPACCGVVPAGPVVVELGVGVVDPSRVRVEEVHGRVGLGGDVAEAVELAVIHHRRRVGTGIVSGDITNRALIVGQGPEDLAQGVLTAEDLIEGAAVEETGC